jgi:pimeloyl-ACP methyl ester carboxylesterase
VKQLTLPSGTSMSYLVKGEGIPLICIHAPGIGFVNFMRQHPLADYCQLVLPDLRGHGSSTPATESFTIADLAKDLVYLIESLQAPQVVVLGYSQGGSLALECCLQLPERIAGAVLISSFSEVNELYLHSRFYMAEALASMHAVSFLARSTAASHLNDKNEQQTWIAHAERTDAYSLHQLYRAGHLYQCTARLHEIHVPVLSLYGSDDKQMHPYGKLMADHLPDCDTQLIPQVKHQVVTKAADACNRLVRDFLRTRVKQLHPV